jgi:hypothetical protein
MKFKRFMHFIRRTLSKGKTTVIIIQPDGQKIKLSFDQSTGTIDRAYHRVPVDSNPWGTLEILPLGKRLELRAWDGGPNDWDRCKGEQK